MAAQSKPSTIFGLLRRIITYLVFPPKNCSAGTTSVEDHPPSEANTSHGHGTDSQRAKQAEETLKAQLNAIAQPQLRPTIDADTADPDSMSHTICNDQVDLHWEKANGRRRGRRRGHLDEQFSAAVDEFQSQMQLNRLAKQEEKQQLEAKQKEVDDNLKAVLDKIVELEEMVAFCRDTATKDADKMQIDTEQANKHDTVFEYVNSRVDELGEKIHDDITALNTQHKDLSDKCNVLEVSEGDIKKDIEENKKFCNELRGRIYVLENHVPARHAEVTNSEAVATPIAGTEQPQAKTRGYHLKKLGALTTMTKAHDEQIQRLEMAVSDVSPKMEKAFEWHEWAGRKFEEYDSCLCRDLPDTSKEIQAAKEQQSQHFTEALTNQKEFFEQQLRQQKEASEKQLSDYKESLQDGMRLQEASIRKECDERLASKDREVAERFAKIDAEQKEQKKLYDNLEKTMKDMIAQFNPKVAIQQSPSPAHGQQQPEAPTLQPTSAQHGNGLWSSTPTPSDQGNQQPFSRNGTQTEPVGELDDLMMEAPPLNPQQPTLQPPRQPAQPKFGTLEDTPMENGELMTPNNNGNVGFLPNSQPMGANPLFSGSGPIQPNPSAPTPSATPANGPVRLVWSNPVATGFGPSTPVSTVSVPPNDKSGATLQNSFFGPGPSRTTILAGQMSLPSLTVTPARAPAPQKIDLNAPAPDWSSYMDLDADDTTSLAAKPKKPSIKDSSPTSLAGQQAASTPAPTTANNNGPSSSVSGPSPTPAKPQAPAPTKPSAPKPKKKPDLFIKKKASSTPSKSNNVTGKVQTSENQGPSPVELKQRFYAGDFSELPPLKKKVDEKPPPPEVPSAFNIPGLTGAVNTSPFAMKPPEPKKFAYEPAPSPAFTPMTPPAEPTSTASISPHPIYKPVAPTVGPLTSPLTSTAAVSDTIATPSTTNMFTKEAEKPAEQPFKGNGHSTPKEGKVQAGNAAAGIAEPAKPAGNPDDVHMAGAEGKPEPTKPLKYEVDVNPRKHAAAAQIVPQEDAKTVKRETQDDAKAHKGGSQRDAQVEMENSQDNILGNKQGSQGDDRMDTDRRVAKPKGKAASMTAADRQRETQKFQEEAAWDAMEKALAWGATQKEKAAAAAADDEVDYGDPNDANDEDLTTTTMAAPLPKVRPTKYSITFFNEWKQHFMSTNSLSSKATTFKCRTKEDFQAFANEVQKYDDENDLGDLLERAALPLKKTQGYTRYEMEKLISTFREWVYFEALRALDLDEMDEDLVHTNERFMAEIVSWFRIHSPDTV